MYTSTVTFLFHADMTQEAMTAIPALPVILEAKFGTTIWNWFSEEAKALSEGYYWDEKIGLKSDKDEQMTDILGEWGAKWGSNDNNNKSASTVSTVQQIEPFKIMTGEIGKTSTTMIAVQSGHFELQ